MNRQRFVYLVIFTVASLIVLDQLGYVTTPRLWLQNGLAYLQPTLTSLSIQFRPQETEFASVSQRQLLEQENNQLKVELVQLREVERENITLRQMLQFTQRNPQFSYQAGEIRGRSFGIESTIIGFDPSNLLYLVYVDVGARNGVAQGMPVISERGMVGRVTAVGGNSAQVLLLIDPSSAVNAVVQNSRATGIVRGNVDGTLTMERIPQNTEIETGDIVLTSGLGGNFPKKLVIGQVIEVTQRDQDLFQTARIRPTVDFGALELVLVITAFTPTDFEGEFLDALPN